MAKKKLPNETLTQEDLDKFKLMQHHIPSVMCLRHITVLIDPNLAMVVADILDQHTGTNPAVKVMAKQLREIVGGEE